MPRPSPLFALVFIVLAGCEGSLVSRPALVDPGPDGGGLDAGPREDAGLPPPFDAGLDSGSSLDAAPPPVDAAAPDAGPRCGSGLTSCGGACVDVMSDPANCGRCGQACAPGGTCETGRCVGGVGCPPAPAGVSDQARAAYDQANEARTATGVGCVNMVPEINLGAERHCQYYQANRGDPMCGASAHEEFPGCPMFVSQRFDGRMRAAGYLGLPAAENMHFIGSGRGAVQGWIDSVYHRNPVLSPWVRDFGYGTSGACDTADYGAGSLPPETDVAVYPYPGQGDVPTAFYGREGPTPPAPPGGYPSGYPITIYYNGEITSHRLTLEGSEADIEHVWLPAGSSTLLRREHVLYAYEPLASGTTYRVRASGTGHAGPLELDWTFTTR